MIGPMARVPATCARSRRRRRCSTRFRDGVDSSAARCATCCSGPASRVDLDVVVEGDAVAAAERLAAALGGAVTRPRPLRHRDGRGRRARLRRRDRARASATRPRARCPRCGRARWRRTCCAATSRSTRSRSRSDGRVALRAPGALEDLDARVLRVLHERSFLDDPTRLLRLVRYATRLGFSVEAGTAALAAAAVAGGALATVTPARLGERAAAAAARAVGGRGVGVGRGVAAAGGDGVRSWAGGAGARAAARRRSRRPAAAGGVRVGRWSRRRSGVGLTGSGFLGGSATSWWPVLRRMASRGG